jgi:CheY-like chemotaxis protein
MKHILVIDPDKSLCGAYVSALESAGYSAAGVAGAESAIGICEEHKPDVIILELQLQGHSGVEFLHELRSYPEWQGIPVILHSMVPSKNLERFKQAFNNLGVVGCAYKPETSLAKLVDLVEEATAVKV